MSDDEFASAERSYRRGFDQGVYFALVAVWPTLTEPQRKRLQGWKREVVSWRYSRRTTRMIEPPRAPPPEGPKPNSDPNGPR